MSLVETVWLEKNSDKVKIIDCSWHLPSTKRNSHEEYNNGHVPNAIFFDLDKNSNQNIDLPHMLPDKNKWEKIVSSMGISLEDKIVIYDNSDLISSCRCWYNFIYFGHNPKLVSVLNGGLKKWKLEKKILTKNLPKIKISNYIAVEKKELVKNKSEIDENIFNKTFDLVDARSKGRFEGHDPEPRKNTKSGSIPNSFCLPYKYLINNEDNTFKNTKEIIKIFNENVELNFETNVVFSCGSGVTAAVLALAYSLINNKYVPSIYDGSWAEYGKIK